MTHKFCEALKMSEPSLKRGGSSKSLGDETASVGSKPESMSPEQKSLMWKTRIIAVCLTVIFVVISLHEAARVVLCVGKCLHSVIAFTLNIMNINYEILGSMSVQLFTIAMLACIWDEGAWLARSDEGSISRFRVITCQIVVVIIPILIGGKSCMLDSGFSVDAVLVLLPFLCSCHVGTSALYSQSAESGCLRSI